MFLQNPLFEKYLALLLKWNKTYNLTAITDPKEIRIKHFEDSLDPLSFLPTPCRLLDIGTGAGFPGIPLKIVRPDLEVVLLDSQRKKVAFCEAVIRELKLKGIQMVWGRAEDPSIQSKVGKFDVVISRATFSITDFLGLAASYLNPAGRAVAMKSSNWREEYVETPDWELQEIYDYVLGQGRGKRTVLIFKSTAGGKRSLASDIRHLSTID